MDNPFDEKNSPDECEVCELYDEHLKICPAGSWKEGYPDFDRCPAVGFVHECEQCKKTIDMFRADFPDNQIVQDSEGGIVYCCSTKCAEDMKKIFIIEDERDFLMRTENEINVCCATCKKATPEYLESLHGICSFSNHKGSKHLLCWVKNEI